MLSCSLWLFVLEGMLAQAVAGASSAEGQFRPEKIAEMDSAIHRAISDNRCPGGVVWIEHRGSVYRKAFGNRALVPECEAASEDTIYDAASLTKVVACAPVVMLLYERGQLSLEDKVQSFIPEFTGEGKDSITVKHLLLHLSGLRGDIETRSASQGQETAIKNACEE